MNKNKIHIGCSSYTTASWRELFYPKDLPQRKWFEYYSQHFKTYEFNGSFYKFPTVESLQPWYEKTPRDFKFSIKAPKIITHIKRLKECEEEISRFYSVSQEGFKEKLACVLFQLPPSFSFSPERLDLILQSMHPDFKNVVEFRNISWWRDDVKRKLEENNITFCSVSYPGLPETIYSTSPIGYVRMHGIPQLFYSEYSHREIEKLYDKIKAREFEEAYVYFNNTATAAGIINAIQFTHVVKSED